MKACRRKILEVSDVDGPLEVGEKYRVECVKLPVGNRLFWIPILCEHVGDIGGTFHYHIDVRFTTDFILQLIDLKPNEVMGVARQRRTQSFIKVCLRQFEPITLLRESAQKSSYNTLQDMVKDRRMDLNCLKCPHQGVDLRQVPVTNGVRVCPAHGLTWDKEGNFVKREIKGEQILM